MKKAGKIIALILMGVIISMNLLTVIGNVAGASGDFSLLPFTFLSVESGSMEPDLSVGDLIIDREVPYEDIRVGDTVTFERNGELITHRVVRLDGSRIVTKGTANNIEDKSFGPESYLGKVVYVLPGLGRVLRFFSNPWSLLCGIIVLFGIFYGGRIADAVTIRKTSFSLVRLMSFLLAASLFLLTPSMTAAKYNVIVNGVTAVAADSRYIGSNMLSEEESEYLVEGWTGGDYGLTVSVISGDNLLKYNGTGQDVLYKFYVLKFASDATETFEDNYLVTLTPSEDIPAASAAETANFTVSAAAQEILDAASEVVSAGPFVLEGNDSRMTTNNFNIALHGDSADPLQVGDRIRYRVMAVTDSATGYYTKLSAEFTMDIAAQQDFIEPQTISTTPGNALVNYELTTGLAGGSGARNVIVRWDNRELYLNEYENNAYEIIHSFGSQYYNPGTETDHSAYLIMSLTSYSSVKLEFFKYDLTLGNADLHITAELYSPTDGEETGQPASP